MPGHISHAIFAEWNSPAFLEFEFALLYSFWPINAGSRQDLGFSFFLLLFFFFFFLPVNSILLLRAGRQGMPHTHRHGLLLEPHVAATIPADKEAEMKLPRKPVIAARSTAGSHPSEQGEEPPLEVQEPSPNPGQSLWVK